MKLACRYGTDAAHPEKGYIEANCLDSQALDIAAHPGCLLILHDGPAEAFGRFGPEPEKLGDPPRSHFASHDELDAQGVAKDHPWRDIAGLPIKDNRKTGIDTRLWAAPDLTIDVARSAKSLAMTAVFDDAATAGFKSKALGAEHLYPSDAEGERKLQMAALAALAGQAKQGWTASLRCAEIKNGVAGAFTGVPHGPTQIHAVLADYQASADKSHADRDAVEAKIAAAKTVDDVLAVKV